MDEPEGGNSTPVMKHYQATEGIILSNLLLSPKLDCYYRLSRHLDIELKIRDISEISFLQVPHFIHREAKPIFYARNKFHHLISRYGLN